MEGSMIRVAIVEDSESEAMALSACLTAWCAKNKTESVSCTVYSDAVKFLEQGSSTADVVLMDIEMPYMNGMDAAAELRKCNPEAILIFVTWATKYAVRGYAVDAIGYLVKPVKEKAFSEVFEKALRLYARRRQNQTVMLKTKSGIVNVSTDKIQYVEADGHLLHIYTENDSYQIWNSVDNMMKTLPAEFVRCHKGYVVNLKHVYSVDKNGIRIVGRPDVLLPVSRPKRTEFMERLMQYYTQTMRR